MRASGEPGGGRRDQEQGSARGKGLLGGQEGVGLAQGGHVDMETSGTSSWRNKELGRTQTLTVQELTSEPPH